MNRDFKEFIDAGGYSKQEFLETGFKKDGKVISWSEAMKAFVDRTAGRAFHLGVGWLSEVRMIIRLGCKLV